MRIQHRMISQPSCRISAAKVRGVREGKGEREEKEDRKNANTGNKSNIKLKLPDTTEIVFETFEKQAADKCSKEHMQPDKF